MTFFEDVPLRGYERSLPIALLRAREATMRKFKPHVDAHNLTLQQWRIIRALADSGPLDATALSERCVILPPSLTRIFRTLTQKGLITQVDDRDGRRHKVALTDEGRRLYEEMAPTSEDIYRRIEESFGEDEMRRLLELLTRLRHVADDMAGGSTSATDEDA
ncbi:MAG: homoprotocatechuate degradation operon regulator HpaR [Rhodobacteraceae bacterium]|nr:homoprotocatechuate degradation operon regulator HpaR [Paracoccaceae bacterium]